MSKKAEVKKLLVEVPAKWGDLAPEQISHMASLMSMELEQDEFLLRFALYCAGLRPHGRKENGRGGFTYCYYKRGMGNVALTSAQLTSLSKAVRWVLDEPELCAAPRLLPGWPSPDNRLFGVSLEQYMTAELAFPLYAQTKDVSALYPLVAALYVDSPYSEKKFKRQVNRAKALPQYQLEAVALWWVGVKSWLAGRYPYLFAPGSGAGGESDGAQSFLDILSSLNEGRIADNELIRRSEVHEALNQLNIKAKAAVESQSK